MAIIKVIVKCDNCEQKCVIKFDDKDGEREIMACPLCGEDAEDYCEIEDID